MELSISIGGPPPAANILTKEVDLMKATLNKTLALFLALVLTTALALPVGAATVPVTGISLDKESLTLAPKATYTLTATVSPENATDKKVTWTSTNTAVATVDSNGKVTTKTKGVTNITATAGSGSYIAVCQVTVEDDYVTDVTITPAGPESLPVGKTRQLKAAVVYAHGSDGDQSVTWTTGQPEVASVTPEGLVTAKSQGKATILALSKEPGKAGSPIMGTYELTVTKAGVSTENDKLTLSATQVKQDLGLGLETTLTAPQVSLKNGTSDVSDGYNLSYRWADSQDKTLGTEAALPFTPGALGTQALTCTVTAASTTDSTQVLTAACTYTLQVLPAVTAAAQVADDAGPVTLEALAGKEAALLTQLTQAVPGLTHVVFDLSSVTGGAAGTLAVQAETQYLLDRQDQGEALAQVIFTPAQAGEFTVQFWAYGEETLRGQFTITVTGQEVEPPVEGSIVCGGTGYTFSGSDFFQSGSADPVETILFGQPSAGLLVRDLARGTGTRDEGAKYYTNSASFGQFHVSTLSYLPKAGFTGQVTIPVTLTTQGGKTSQEVIDVYVTGKTHSDHFVDVTEADVGGWAAASVDFCHDFGLVAGMENSTFAPAWPMTRAQLVTILYRASGSPEVTWTTNFTDLDVGAYYYNAVVWATLQGVVNGTGETTFSPDSNITREQIATILSRYAEATGGDMDASGTLASFSDRGLVSGWAKDPMLWAVSHGIITGTTATTLSPQDTATRAQVVVMLHRYLTD